MRVDAQHVKISLQDINGWDVPRPAVRQARSAGLHVSEIIRDVAIRGGLLKVEKVRVGKRVETWVEDELDGSLLVLGLAWEAWMAGLRKDMVWQPAEQQVDGVYMNLDGLTVDSGAADNGAAVVVEEFKATRKSSEVKGEARNVAGEWMWIAQIKSYCRAVQTTRARLHVLYVNGNYRFSEEGGKPTYMRYELEFTEQELEDSWAVLMRAARRMMVERLDGQTRKEL
jgi:hypothetical protein